MRCRKVFKAVPDRPSYHSGEGSRRRPRRFSLVPGTIDLYIDTFAQEESLSTRILLEEEETALKTQPLLDSSETLNDPLLKNYPLSERRAVLVHRYYLGIELRKEPSLEDAIQSWEAKFARPWRRKKALHDVAAQLEEIKRHKYHLSQKAGRDVGWEAAAADWVTTHASAWREWWERQPGSNP